MRLLASLLPLFLAGCYSRSAAPPPQPSTVYRPAIYLERAHHLHRHHHPQTEYYYIEVPPAPQTPTAPEKEGVVIKQKFEKIDQNVQKLRNRLDVPKTDGGLQP